MFNEEPSVQNSAQIFDVCKIQLTDFTKKEKKTEHFGQNGQIQ